MSDIRDAFNRIDRLFTSGNSIPVERVVITREMWDWVKAARAQPEPSSGVQSSECSTCNGEGGTYEPEGHRDAMLFVCPDCDGSGDAPEPSAGTVPEGWKPVPERASEAMMDAGRLAGVPGLITCRDAATVWHAMLDAAPQPPQEGE